MALVGQADGDEVGPLAVQHLVEVGVAAHAEFLGALLGLFGGATGDGDELDLGVRCEDPRVLPTPAARADERDLDHCSITTLPVSPFQNSSNASWILSTPMRWVMILPRYSRFALRSL